MATFNNKFNANVAPVQKLPASLKNDEWQKTVLDYYISKFFAGSNTSVGRRHDMKVAYDLYNSVFDESDFKYITDPYKVKEGFPASVQNFNIIKPKIDLLLGEESKRPFPFRVVQTNEEATSALQEKQKEEFRTVMFELASSGSPEDPITDKDIEKLEQADKYINTKQSTKAELLAYHILKYLMEKEDINTKFIHNFHNLLASSMVVFYAGQVGQEPVLEVVNPLTFSFDESPEVKYIEDGEYAIRRMDLTPIGIYDRFQDKMEEKDLNELLDKYHSGHSSMNNIGEFKSIDFKPVPFISDAFTNGNTEGTIPVYHVTWKSYKKVGFLTYIDELGNELTDCVDESYETDENEDIRWEWIIEVWEGYRIGEDIYIGAQPIPEQAISIDQPTRAKLPYVGAVFNNNNTEPKSLIDIMKPLQYMYIVIWYRLELALARDKGKVLNMDVTQIPKSMGMDVNKWLHYLSASGINFVNPYEDGWDIPGREGGKASSFNQFSQVDLTMSDVIVGYINLMNKIEEMVGEISGVSRQRQGEIQSSELVGNVQQTIMQSSLITEMLFYNYTQVKKRVLNSLLNVAKNIYHKSNKKKLHYITDDAIRIFMDITDDFLNSDMGVFVTDSTKENQDIEMLKSLYQPAMQNGASLLDIASIITSTNLSDIKTKLDKIEKNRLDRETEMQEMQQQAAMQVEQLRAQIADKQMQLETERLRIQEEDSIRKAETAIQVAMIGANNNAESANENVDMLEQVKLNMQKDKQEKDFALNTGKLQETIRHNLVTENISKNKPKTISKK